jgi:hypothetical protein
VGIGEYSWGDKYSEGIIIFIVGSMVKVVVAGKTFEFDEKVNNLTTYFKDLKEFEGNKESFEVKNVKEADAANMLEACTKANYEFKQVAKVSGSDASAYIGAPLNDYFNKLYAQSPNQLNTLYRAARELRLGGLENNIAAFLAAKVFIKTTVVDYNNKKKELGIKAELTPQLSRELKDRYGFLN